MLRFSALNSKFFIQACRCVYQLTKKLQRTKTHEEQQHDQRSAGWKSELWQDIHFQCTYLDVKEFLLIDVKSWL